MRRKIIIYIYTLFCFLCFGMSISMNYPEFQETVIPAPLSAPNTEPLPFLEPISQIQNYDDCYFPIALYRIIETHRDDEDSDLIFNHVCNSSEFNLLKEDIFGQNIIHLLARSDYEEELLDICRQCISSSSCIFKNKVHPKTLNQLFNHQDIYGDTPLSKVRSLEMYNLMVKNGADPKHVNNARQNLLFYYADSTDLFLNLFNSDPDFFKLIYTDSHNRTPIDLIIAYRNYELLDILLTDYTELFPLGNDFVLKLSQQFYSGRDNEWARQRLYLLDRLWSLKKITKNEVCFCNNRGVSPIGYAVDGYDPKLIQWLFQHGGYMSVQDCKLLERIKRMNPTVGKEMQKVITQCEENVLKQTALN